MSQDTDRGGKAAVATRTVELIVAGVLMLVAAVTMWESWKVGARWGQFGPESGYFPLRIGALLMAASGATFVTTLFARERGRAPFVQRDQLKQVLQVLIPTTVFVGAVGYLGLYVAGAVFIAFFMWWLGKYKVRLLVPVAIAVPLVLFVLFEIWFLVPMPKGPLEHALGF